MRQPRVILVGGFLGAGKTTLIGRAAAVLGERGHRVGIITNDQATDLVDTALLGQRSDTVGEVGGGCFCCQFTDFFSELQRVQNQSRADILIGEPVGSCTDLAATVLRPLRAMHAETFRAAPFSVLADPVRLADALRPRGQRSFPDSVLYIYRLQLEEADALVINKADLVSPAELDQLKAELAKRYPGRPLFVLSARTGEGVERWLDFILDGVIAGQRRMDVDYALYAEGEAVLGWLNASARLVAPRPHDWGRLCPELLERVRTSLGARIEIAHAKALLTTASGWASANLTSSDGAIAAQTQLATDAADASLILNVRAAAAPTELEPAIRSALQAIAAENGAELSITRLQCFKPAPPRPTHRLAT